VSDKETGAPAPTPAAPPIDVKEVRNGERERAKTILELATKHGFAEKVAEWLGSERTVDSIRQEILDTRSKEVKPTTPGTAEDLGLTEKEQRGFSLVAAIRQAAGIEESGFEMEVSEGISKRLGKTPRNANAFWFPIDLPAVRIGPAMRSAMGRDPLLAAEVGQLYGKRAGLDSKTTTAGLELKFTEPGSFIELLRNSTKVIPLGATFLPGLQGNVAFPRQTGAGTASWVAENPGSDVADSNLALDQVLLSPKFLMSTTSYSKNLLTQAVIDVEQLVRGDLALITAIAIDAAAIAGTAASSQPRGILTQSGIGSVTLGANGGTVSWNALVDLERVVDAANALRGKLAYLTTPGQRGNLKKISQISATTGLPVWFMNEINGYRAESSTNVPSNLTKGTSTTICHAIIFGDWGELLIGQWNALELVVDPYRLKKQAMIEVTSFVSIDIAVRHAPSFAAIVDALQ
jgi:HK97 family phage major capsid protein